MLGVLVTITRVVNEQTDERTKKAACAAFRDEGKHPFRCAANLPLELYSYVVLRVYASPSSLSIKRVRGECAQQVDNKKARFGRAF
jgi:hypothetical protein